MPGGGSYKGTFVQGKRHGCGVFTWQDGESEMREYRMGVLQATRVLTHNVLSPRASSGSQSARAPREDRNAPAKKKSGSQRSKSSAIEKNLNIVPKHPERQAPKLSVESPRRRRKHKNK